MYRRTLTLALAALAVTACAGGSVSHSGSRSVRSDVRHDPPPPDLELGPDVSQDLGALAWLGDVEASTTTTPPAPARRAVATGPTPAPAVGSSFQACVMTRESSNGRGSSNLYGILDSTWHSLGLAGSAGSASPAVQAAAFWELYRRDGTAPWRPYDGC